MRVFVQLICSFHHCSIPSFSGFLPFPPRHMGGNQEVLGWLLWKHSNRRAPLGTPIWIGGKEMALTQLGHWPVVGVSKGSAGCGNAFLDYPQQPIHSSMLLRKKLSISEPLKARKCGRPIGHHVKSMTLTRTTSMTSSNLVGEWRSKLWTNCSNRIAQNWLQVDDCESKLFGRHPWRLHRAILLLAKTCRDRDTSRVDHDVWSGKSLKWKMFVSLRSFLQEPALKTRPNWRGFNVLLPTPSHSVFKDSGSAW